MLDPHEAVLLKEDTVWNTAGTSQKLSLQIMIKGLTLALVQQTHQKKKEMKCHKEGQGVHPESGQHRATA